MPSLHQLWKTLHSQTQTQTQNRLRIIFARSVFNTKPSFSYTSGEPSSQFEFPGSFSKLSELADPGKPLSIPQAASRALATPSVHGSVWQSFCYNSRQALLDRNQPDRSKQTLGWTIASSHYRNTKGKHLKLEARLHVCSLDIPSESSISTLGFTKQWGYQRNVPSWEEETQKLGLNRVGSMDFLRLTWTCDLEDAGQNKDSNYNREERNEEKSQLRWLLSTCIAFHFLQCGPCLLPVVGELFQRAVYGFTCGGAAAIRQSGLMSDHSVDNESVEIRGKHRERSLSSKGLRLLSAACCLPHPEKQDTGGEDAYFICPDKQVIGVADGVGGWADVGVDAGEYARQLMNQSLIAARQEPAGCIDTARVMEIAHSKTTCRGSSTACILALSDYGLQAANLGDSGFLVVRNGRMIFKTPVQQHNFNVPFQLENGGGDPPDAAEVFTVEVAVGDVIVAGTDGLFDNLYDTELVSIVVQATRSGLSPDITAQKIASLARLRAQDCNRQTPFSTAAQDAGFRFYGGKMDDITVIVSYVVN